MMTLVCASAPKSSLVTWREQSDWEKWPPGSKSEQTSLQAMDRQ